MAFHSLYRNRQETLKQRRDQKIQQQQEEMKSKVFTFKPEVSTQSTKLAAKKRTAAAFSKEWEENLILQQFAKEAALLNKRAAGDREKLKECTFKPTVC